MLTPSSSAALLPPAPRNSQKELLSYNGQVALRYAAAGFYVFPCNASRTKHEDGDRLPYGKADKRPLVSSWSKEATTDAKQIQQWWTQHPEALVGLPCKQNRLLVIDADRHTSEQDGVAHFADLCGGQDEPMPPHPVIITDYEGEHHIFRMPEEPIGQGKNRLPPGVDIRGYRHSNDGGYIIAAGSRMLDGRGWRRMKGTPSLREALPLPPHWLIYFCQPPQIKPVSQPIAAQGKAEEAYALAALNRVARELAATPKTKRDNTLVSVAGTMGRMIQANWIGYATVEGRLLDACRMNGLSNEISDNVIRDKIRRATEAVSPHEPLPERGKGNGKDTAATEHQKQTVHDWDDPDISLLDNRRGMLPDFPIDIFSPKLQETLKRTAKGAGVTVGHVALPFIGITSGLIGYSRRVKAANSWFEPATCCTALVGYSGTGKTPAHNVTRKPLRAVERLQKEKEEKRKRDHETKKTKAKAEYDKWKAKVAEAVEAGLPVPDMPASAVDPGRYVPIRLVVNDSTVERLAELLQVRPQGIVLVRDELAALYMNMSRYNSGQDDEFWLESWNGQPHTVERMGRNLDIDHLLIGVVGGMQPDKLVASFEGDHDGKYARVLFAWPDEPEWLGLSNEATEIDEDIQNIISRILTLAEFDGDRLLPLVIALDAEAEEEFEQFAQFAHREKRALEGREREWWAKATAHVLRLVNTLVYVEWGLDLKVEKPDAVNKATMQAAIRLVRDYFWPHARACLRLIGLTERHTNAKRALAWIRAKEKTEVSREDIRRDALSQRLDAAQTDDLLKSLCASGWLREEVTPPGPQGGKPARRWLVNPKLHGHPAAQTALTAET